MERITSEDEITVRTHDGIVLAHFEDCGNGMDGEICEGNRPLPDGSPVQLSASDLIAVAAWLLTKAEERTQYLEHQL